MKFNLFGTLYDEASHYDSLEMYIGERGWQSWMDMYTDDLDADIIVKILTLIYHLGNMKINDLRNYKGLSRAEFCRLFIYPESTVRTWESDEPANVKPIKRLMAYTIFMEEMLDDFTKQD